nr:hypothetical protein CFP56_02725 [Quercus suber]
MTDNSRRDGSLRESEVRSGVRHYGFVKILRLDIRVQYSHDRKLHMIYAGTAMLPKCIWSAIHLQVAVLFFSRYRDLTRKAKSSHTGMKAVKNVTERIMGRIHRST